jgi:hypothetical protein
MNNDLVVLDLDRLRTVKLSNKAMKLVEKTLGANINAIVSGLADLSMDEMTVIIHAGLLHEDKELTLSRVEDLLDEYCNFGDLIKTIVSAFKCALGTGLEPKKEENPNV